MKTKHLLLIICALTFCGCVPPDPDGYLDMHYFYGNATDKSITVEVFRRNPADLTAITRDTSFVVFPGKEFELVFRGIFCQPFDLHEAYRGYFITYSNGDKTFTQDIDSEEGYNWLLKCDSYIELIELKSYTDKYYKYVFTDKDFEDPAVHYIYGNDTDKNITVEAFSRLDPNDSAALTRDTSFVIEPGKEFVLVFEGKLREPFSFHNTTTGHVVTYSNGEKTYKQDIDAENGIPWLLDSFFYHPLLTERMVEYRKFVFADKDFEGEPDPAK